MLRFVFVQVEVLSKGQKSSELLLRITEQKHLMLSDTILLWTLQLLLCLVFCRYSHDLSNYRHVMLLCRGRWTFYLKRIYCDELRIDEGHQFNISCVTDRRFIDSPQTVCCQSISRSVKVRTRHFYNLSRSGPESSTHLCTESRDFPRDMETV